MQQVIKNPLFFPRRSVFAIEFLPAPMISCRAVRFGRDGGSPLRQESSRPRLNQPSGRRIDRGGRRQTKSLRPFYSYAVSYQTHTFMRTRARSTSQFSIKNRLTRPGKCQFKPTFHGTAKQRDGNPYLHPISFSSFIYFRNTSVAETGV
jgi:hypothetical protein